MHSGAQKQIWWTFCHISANNYREMLVEGILERCGETKYDKIKYNKIKVEILGVWGPITIFGHLGLNCQF